jgi:hypothetical protein
LQRLEKFNLKPKRASASPGWCCLTIPLMAQADHGDKAGNDERDVHDAADHL